MRLERTTPSALTFARLLGEGPMARVALEALLSELGSPAFIVSARATVLHANTAGAKRIAASKDKLHAKLAAALRAMSDPNATSPAALVTPLKCGTLPSYFLVVFRAPSSTEANIEFRASLWELTPRQHEVLALLAEGFSNKTIAVRLGCAERTVETHLTAIFQKSGFDGRAALLAAIMRDKI